MQLLKELLDLDEGKKTKSQSKTTAQSVYHRDYMKTKKKPYRKYDPKDHANTGDSK